MTSEEYLRFERASERKHEFYDGQVFAMAGSSVNHNQICVHLLRRLGNALAGGPCRSFGMDLRLRVEESGLYTYPDVVVVCGAPDFEDGNKDTLINPIILFEVLSPTTEKYDRGKKFAMYSRLDSLKEYVLVSQEEMRIEHFIREGVDDWHLTVVHLGSDALRLRGVQAELELVDIYERI